MRVTQFKFTNPSDRELSQGVKMFLVFIQRWEK